MTNLLIVFGGTTQVEPQGIFDDNQLANTEVLQFNFVAGSSNITVREKRTGEYKKWVIRDKGWIWDDVKISSDANAQKIKTALESAGKALVKVNWDGLTALSNDALGLQLVDRITFLEAIETVITAFHDQWPNYYDQVYVVAHSRGCLLATGSMAHIKSKYGDKLKRVVLLDPVSMSPPGTYEVSSNDFIQFANANHNVGLHLILKGRTALINYISHAPGLIGLPSEESYFRDATQVNMKNVYVHFADMTHEGMLDKKLRDYFPHYAEIISNQPWTTMYIEAKAIDVQGIIARSEYLNSYKNNEVPACADNLIETMDKLVKNGTINDADKIYGAIPRDHLKKRIATMIHCLACK